MITLRMMLKDGKAEPGQRYLDVRGPTNPSRVAAVTDVDGQKVTLNYTEHGTNYMFESHTSFGFPVWAEHNGRYWSAYPGREKDVDRFVLLRGRVQT